MNKLVSYTEVTGFLAEHNLQIATADHLGPPYIFPDSKITKAHARGKTLRIFNCAIDPDL